MRTRAISSQATAVLETLSQQHGDRMSIRRLVDLLRAGHGSSNSTRASLSRTLRRLRRDGFVELTNDWNPDRTLTERHAKLDTELAQHEADPEADYASLLAKIACGTVPALYDRGSSAAHLEHTRRQIESQKRHLRNNTVVLTAGGLELLTVDREAVNSAL